MNFTSPDRAREIRDQLAEENPDALCFDGFDEALVGIARRATRPSLAAYDYWLCIAVLVRDMPEDEAIEFFEFNTMGAWVGEGTPIVLDLSDPLVVP